MSEKRTEGRNPLDSSVETATESVFVASPTVTPATSIANGSPTQRSDRDSGRSDTELQRPEPRNASSAQVSSEALALPADPIGGRYRVVRLLGHGGGGRVFEAVDLETEQLVAVKLLWTFPPTTSLRITREIAALRALRLPGVVELLAEGWHGDERFIAMTLIEGAPFPGPLARPEWSAIAVPTLRLLTILQRIHDAGIVHRDLKPSNVLVDGSGEPRVLDFGLARGAPLGPTMTRSGTILGTPRYQAPEQIMGLRTDARADLYSLGVMLYEALSGRRPHEAEDVNELRLQRSRMVPEPLCRIAVDVPRHVGDVVDRLLAREPASRPSSAADIYAALEGGPGRAGGALPWLGSTVVLEQLLETVQAGRSVTLGGPQGCGKTRHLDELAERLRERGQEVAFLTRGERPYSSLAALLEGSTIGSADPDEVSRVVGQSLRERLTNGLIVLADDGDAIDSWTRRALADNVDAGTIVKVVPESEAADVIVGPLSEADLRPLFAGPDRLFHLIEDGARILHERSRGLPSRVVAEAGAWVASGLARWTGAKLTMTRSDLRRLRSRESPPAPDRSATADLSDHLAEVLAWVALAHPCADPNRLAHLTERPSWEIRLELAELERRGAVRGTPEGAFEPAVPAFRLQTWSLEERCAAHARMAALLPRGEPGRFRHLLAAGQPATVADEAVALAREHFAAGQLGDAIAIVLQALSVVRQPGGHTAESTLVIELARLALSDETRPSVTQALEELRKSREPTPTVLALGEILEAALALDSGHPEDAEQRASQVAPFDDPELEVMRHQVRVAAALRLDTSRTERLLDELAPWLEDQDGAIAGKYHGWLGVVRYHQGEFLKSSSHHEEAARLKSDAAGRLASRINSALALMEAFHNLEARVAAEAVRVSAEQLRLPLYEAFAERVVRAVAYRLGEATEPDWELVTACEVLGYPRLTASIHLNEAAIAWRAGDLASARKLARSAFRHWNESAKPLAAGLARSLLIAADGEVPAGDIAALADLASTSSHGRIGAQILGLIAKHSSAPGVSVEAARRLAEQTPREDWERRLEVLSLAEAIGST